MDYFLDYLNLCGYVCVVLFIECFPTRSEERYVHDYDYIMIMVMIMFVMSSMGTTQSLVILRNAVPFNHAEKALLKI